MCLNCAGWITWNQTKDDHMSELTENTVNFCRHHTPFRAQRIGGRGEPVFVMDRFGMIICTCPREDDAWTIYEALNEIGKRESGKAETKA